MMLMLALALAEAALLAPLMQVMLSLPPAFGAAGTLALVWLTLFGLGVQWQFMASRHVTLATQRIWMGAWLVALIVMIEANVFLNVTSPRPDVLTMLPGFLSALLVWWRGMALGTSELTPRDADLHLQIGLLILVLFGVATLLSRDLEIWLYLGAFFFGALTAVPLANLEQTHVSAIGRRVPMTFGWWGWALVVPGVVLVLGLVLTALMTGRSVAMLIGLFLTILLLPVVLLVSLIPQSFFDAIAEMLRRLGEMLGNLPQFGDALQQRPSAQQPASGPIVSTEVSFIIGLIGFAALVAVVIVLMRRADRTDRAPRAQAADTEGDLGTAASIAGTSEPEGFSLAGLRRWLAAVTIRRLYVRAGREAARRGFRREPAQTPYDFLPTMQRAFPTAERDAQTITDAYVAAHYGQVPDTRDALEALRAAWERMRATR
jgi:hypothetical protein